MSWEVIVRTLELHERTKGVGDGVIEGYKYRIIQRGDEISIVLPDYEPRERCLEASNKIFSKLAPEATIQIVTLGHASSYCNYCLKPTSLPYRCHRCEGWYCEGHRLPEQHNCPEDKAATEGVIERVRKNEKNAGKKEIVVIEVPCG